MRQHRKNKLTTAQKKIVALRKIIKRLQLRSNGLYRVNEVLSVKNNRLSAENKQLLSKTEKLGLSLFCIGNTDSAHRALNSFKNNYNFYFIGDILNIWADNNSFTTIDRYTITHKSKNEGWIKYLDSITI